MRTKAGEVLITDLADALAAEAEQGYDLTKGQALEDQKGDG
jgi:hypothetical protein